jgi:peptidoglycan/LPS O-acetylase OafA/YrhL
VAGEIVPLTSIRGVAAIWVAAYHLVGEMMLHGWMARPSAILWNLVNGGADFAVDLFFVLSGYILAETYGARSDTAAFYAHRAARVLPLHWTVLTVLALAVGVLEAFGVHPRSAGYYDWGKLPYAYTLTSVWVNAVAWNAPTWSLNAELAAYLLFPFMQGAARRLGPALLFGLGLLFVAGHVSLIESLGFRSTGAVSIARGVLGFGAGAMLRFATGRRPTPAWLPTLCVAAIGVIACAGAYAVAIVPSAALIVALAAPARSPVHRLLSAPVLAWLGRISFSIYLVHEPVMLLASHVISRLPLLHASPVGIWPGALLCLAMTLVVADRAWRWVEMPARRLLRRRWDAARGTAADGAGPDGPGSAAALAATRDRRSST